MKPGNVPTALVGPKLDMLIRDRWPHGGSIVILAEKVGCDSSAIEGIIEQIHPGVSFDLVDRLFCALGRPMEDVGLADLYWGVGFVETCGSPACSKTFPERAWGERRKQYCSKSCQRLAEGIKRGVATGLRSQGKCNRGHRLTPENTQIKSSGHRQCRICVNDRRRERMSDPAYRAKAREYNARYHRQKRAAKAAA